MYSHSSPRSEACQIGGSDDRWARDRGTEIPVLKGQNMTSKMVGAKIVPLESVGNAIAVTVSTPHDLLNWR